MKLTLDIRKSLEENAADYFEKAKKARSKISGAKKAIEKAKESHQKAKDTPLTITKQVPKKIRKRSWYEKFKWFFASNGMLVIGGRDATTNEILIKKYTDETDLVFHTGSAGSPFVVIKSEGKEIPDKIKQEATDYCGSHSKAWKLGLSDAEVYWVEPKQVTKEAKAGEYMSKGSFMVYGKRNFMHPKIGLGATPFEDKILVAPISTLKNSEIKEYAHIAQGTTKTSDAAKQVIAILEVGEVDDIVPLLPSGGCSVKRSSS